MGELQPRLGERAWCASHHPLRAPGPPPLPEQHPETQRYSTQSPDFYKKAGGGSPGWRAPGGSPAPHAAQRHGQGGQGVGRGWAGSGDPRPAAPGSPRPLAAERAAAQRRPSPHGSAPAPPPPLPPPRAPRGGSGPGLAEPQQLGQSPPSPPGAPRPPARAPLGAAPCSPPGPGPLGRARGRCGQRGHEGIRRNERSWGYRRLGASPPHAALQLR